METTLQINHSRRIPSKLKRKSLLFLLAAFFYISLGHAQLPAFDLFVGSTDESCPGNGMITFNANNTVPGSSVIYRVYLLPNTTSPIAVLSTNSVSGLVSGNYQVVATQTLGAQSSTQTENITIANTIEPLAYTISGTPVTCGNNGTMTVNVFAGTAASYEIISGPATAPLQASNVFTGLPVGLYQVRVFDNCGQGWVTAHNLFASLGTSLEWTESDQAEVVDCNQITITNTLSPALNSAITFPVTIIYTIHPPGGGADIINTIYMASGDISGQEFVTVIPYYSNQVYTYNVTVQDACGNGYYFDNILINKPFLAQFKSPPAECGEYFLGVVLDHFMPPVTINFSQYPAGFDPGAFNPAHPGPFTDNLISYGDAQHPVPYGHYEGVATDACGRSVPLSIDLEYHPPELIIEVSQNSGCNSDTSNVVFKVTTGYKLQTAFITSGPGTFSTGYPVDFSSAIDPGTGSFEIQNMPTGTYTITATDDCGNTYDEEFIVPDKMTFLTYMMWPGCEEGKGSIRIRGADMQLAKVEIIDAPTAYGQALPHDVSYNISGAFPDTFSMNGFAPGEYTFKVLDSCGLTNEVTITVVGFEVEENTYSLTRHCGSFDLDFHFYSWGTPSTFWLQRFDPITGTWGHPQTGAPYLPGDIPSLVNSLLITQSNGMTYNISYLGDFRIIHRFQSFGNGSDADLFRLCTDVVQEFTFINELQITDIQKATCNGVNSDVSVAAIGVPPLTYQIIGMNSSPYFFDNGNNNIFANLQPAVYEFQVFDSCGNISTQLTDVALLPSLVQINQPGNIVECDSDDNDNKANFNLIGQNNAVLGGAIPGNFTITYHLTAAEATTGINSLPAVFNSESREVFCRMQYNNVPTCFDIVSFFLTVNPHPDLNMQLTQAICEGQEITITADPGFESYLWSTGETTQSIVVDTPGIYTLEITQTTNGITCTATYTINIVHSQPATIHHIETSDWTNEQNTITVILDEPGNGNYSFSLDNIHFQSGNTFYGLVPGLYTVYINDTNGCEGVTQQVYLLAYPKFFTPNNDGYNDFWQIFYAKAEPGLKVYIFDRYGKLLTGFGSESVGWDGRYNSKEMPSTDYWFLVIRQDGQEHRGHFAMKR